MNRYEITIVNQVTGQHTDTFIWGVADYIAFEKAKDLAATWGPEYGIIWKG